MTVPADNIEQRIKDALADKEVPHIHFNGFVNSIGTGDVIIVLESNNRPIAILNASYTVAKTLALKLGGLIHHLEEKSNNTIMTTDDITKVLSQGDDHDKK